MLEILIVNYNTQLLTDCTINSVNKTTPNCHIYVFDNSDKEPFVNKHKNVTVLDNTKGQLIDFNAFLDKYPNKVKSNGYKANYAGSAKHCYTIDFFMKTYKKNFVLLDSDVIVKLDLNELADDKFIFVGDIGLIALTRDVYRVYPFVCYINTEMCLKNNVPYFDENYMHGLHKTQDGDRYDTGGGFFVHAKKFPFKKISYRDYVIHYKGGSWDDTAARKVFKNGTQEEFINKYKRFWDQGRRKVVYTCISGPYDTLKCPRYVDPDYDYICFTDQLFSSDVWIIKPIPKDLEGLTNVKKQRAVKLLPHKYLPEYDVSVWVDANIDIKGSVSKYVDENMDKSTCLAVGVHPERDCIYEEEKQILKLKKDVKEITEPQMNKYRDEGMPSNFGLPQTCIMLRRHNDKRCINFDELWWKEVKEHSHRDQLSFSYAMWKIGKEGIKFLSKSIFSCDTFYYTHIHIKPRFKQKLSEQPTVKVSEPKQQTQTYVPLRKRVEAILNSRRNINPLAD